MEKSGNEARRRPEKFGSAGSWRFQGFGTIFGDHVLVVVVEVVVVVVAVVVVVVINPQLTPN